MYWYAPLLNGIATQKVLALICATLSPQSRHIRYPKSQRALLTVSLHLRHLLIESLLFVAVKKIQSGDLQTTQTTLKIFFGFVVKLFDLCYFLAVLYGVMVRACVNCWHKDTRLLSA
jgi:hypothetical protein